MFHQFKQKIPEMFEEPVLFVWGGWAGGFPCLTVVTCWRIYFDKLLIHSWQSYFTGTSNIGKKNAVHKKTQSNLVGGWINPSEKIWVKIGSFPPIPGWKSKIFELPPPRNQWSFLVPSISGRYYIIPQLAVYTTCKPPVKGTRNSYWRKLLLAILLELNQVTTQKKSVSWSNLCPSLC